jgi:hypothetical protein
MLDPVEVKVILWAIVITIFVVLVMEALAYGWF